MKVVNNTFQTMQIKKDEVVGSTKGKLIEKEDFCDCLSKFCPGCFYPCEKCSSTKCGHQCRVGRGWNYDKVIRLLVRP